MALTARAAAVSCILLALAAPAAAAGSGSRSHAPAPAPAPAPSVDCTSVALGLSDCLNYVTPGSTDKQPSKACCGEVKTAVADPAAVNCLCQLAGAKNLPIAIDMKRVLALPGACGASNNVFSNCNLTGAPTEAPTPSEGGSSSGGTTAPPPRASAASSPMTATALVAAVAAPLLAYCYLF